jgi:hypothetical protein
MDSTVPADLLKRKPSADWFDILFITSSLVTKGSQFFHGRRCLSNDADGVGV